MMVDNLLLENSIPEISPHNITTNLGDFPISVSEINQLIEAHFH